MATSPLVVLPVLPPCSSSTRLTLPVLVSRTTPSPPRVEETASSTVSWMSTARPSSLTVLPVSTEVSSPPLSVSSSTVVSTLVSTILSVSMLVFQSYSLDALTYLAEPVVLVGPLEGSFLASFGLGWGVTIGAGLASYPLDTIRRRMMMTSGGTVHYKSMFDAGSQIIAKEGTKSLFKGAGANILRGVAGAGVLSLYDKLQQVMFGKVYSGGVYSFHCDVIRDTNVCVQDLVKYLNFFGTVVLPSVSLTNRPCFASAILFSHFGRHFVGAHLRYQYEPTRKTITLSTLEMSRTIFRWSQPEERGQRLRQPTGRNLMQHYPR